MPSIVSFVPFVPLVQTGFPGICSCQRCHGTKSCYRCIGTHQLGFESKFEKRAADKPASSVSGFTNTLLPGCDLTAFAQPAVRPSVAIPRGAVFGATIPVRVHKK